MDLSFPTFIDNSAILDHLGLCQTFLNIYSSFVRKLHLQSLLEIDFLGDTITFCIFSLLDDNVYTVVKKEFQASVSLRQTIKPLPEDDPATPIIDDPQIMKVIVYDDDGM